MCFPEVLGRTDVKYFKVFSCGKSEAKLFIVLREESGHRIGGYYLTKVGGHWKTTRIGTVWASHGDADGYTWPPYW